MRRGEKLLRTAVYRRPAGYLRSMSERDGEVSEVSGMREQPEEIDPEDAVAGAPDAESDGARTGTAGPDAPPHEGRPGTEPDPDPD